MINALSVDVEDWYMVGAFERTICRADWPSKEVRVERNTDAVLALFDDAGVKSTFFTLGCVAEAHPALIRRIVDAGHEIASHGWNHIRVFTMTPDQFRADTERARKLLLGDAVLRHALGEAIGAGADGAQAEIAPGGLGGAGADDHAGAVGQL